MNRLMSFSRIFTNRCLRTGRSTQVARHCSQRGLTLVEIIIVLVILSSLLVFLTGGLFKSGEKAKAKMNSLRMTKLKSAVQEYQLMYNSFPASLDALIRCDEVSGQACVPITEEEQLYDAWGTKFLYTQNGRSYTIKSLGSDRKAGGTGVEGDATLTGP